MPSVKLLKRFGLEPFIDIRKAVTTGNLQLLTDTLDKHQVFFIKTGTYLILEKLKILTYRNLFKKTSLILGNHQLPIEVQKHFYFLTPGGILFSTASLFLFSALRLNCLGENSYIIPT